MFSSGESQKSSSLGMVDIDTESDICSGSDSPPYYSRNSDPPYGSSARNSHDPPYYRHHQLGKSSRDGLEDGSDFGFLSPNFI
jgi:hypothetical protein